MFSNQPYQIPYDGSKYKDAKYPHWNPYDHTPNYFQSRPIVCDKTTWKNFQQLIA